MRKVFNLVSDQAIPSVLFTKEMNPSGLFYFITTSKMESKNASEKIALALNLTSANIKVIEVLEDSLVDIEDKLQKSISIEDDDEILVNITGGTKIMSLGVFNFFARLGTAKIYYLPIGKNELLQVFPLRKNTMMPLSARINLEEYLTAYGVEFHKKSFQNKNNLTKPKDVTSKIFESVKNGKKDNIFKISEQVRKNDYRKKSISGQSIKFEEIILFNEVMSLSEYGFKFDSSNVISRSETKYITGDWFEEFIYINVKETLQISDENIGIGVQLIKNGTPNEYDVIFTHNNSLNVIECKTDVSDSFLGEEDKISYLFTNTLYKAATLKKEFGLWVNYYLFTLNDFSKLTDNQKKRAERLDVKLAGIETLKDSTTFKNYILKMR